MMDYLFLGKVQHSSFPSCLAPTAHLQGFLGRLSCAGEVLRGSGSLKAKIKEHKFLLKKESPSLSLQFCPPTKGDNLSLNYFAGDNLSP